MYCYPSVLVVIKNNFSRCFFCVWKDVVVGKQTHLLLFCNCVLGKQIHLSPSNKMFFRILEAKIFRIYVPHPPPRKNRIDVTT